MLPVFNGDPRQRRIENLKPLLLQQQRQQQHGGGGGVAGMRRHTWTRLRTLRTGFSFKAPSALG